MGLAATLLLVFLLLLHAEATEAATEISVCASGCDHTTIQAAVDAASPGDTVSLASETYSETVTIDRSLTIRGVGAGLSVIDGGAAGTVVTAHSGTTVTLESLTVRNGRTAGDGGGIHNQGTLTLRSVVVTGSVAASIAASRGGGIYSTGQLTVLDSIVSGNEAQAGGGGIFVSGSTARGDIRRSEIFGNRVRDLTTDFRGGGGLHVVLADVTVANSSISGNTTDFTGGGITLRGSGATLELLDSTVDSNVSRLGVGITVQQSAQLTMSGSTISNNVGAPGQSSTGGGIRAKGRVTVSNSTFFGNVVTLSGGAILAESLVTLDSTTIVGNTAGFGGGIASFSAGTSFVNNSIIADNAATDAGNDCNGTLDGGSDLLIQDVTGCNLAAVANVTVADPGLGPLQDNGGPTLTLEPDPTSPAVDSGATALTSDQRGLPRPSGSASDIGAVEVQAAFEDTAPPTWTSGAVAATSVSTSGFTVEWSGATDDVAVTAYEVSVDGGLIETVLAPATSTTVGGLSPGTPYLVEVQALDGAGNRSNDGPSAIVTTAAALPATHLFPPAGAPSVEWQGLLPAGELEVARGLGQVLVLASAATHDQVQALVNFATPTPIDVDGDGSEDIVVTINLGPGPGIIPEAAMTVSRSWSPGPEDVQIVALIPLPDELATTVGKATFAVGFGTTAAAGLPGGYLPDIETIMASVDQLQGLAHRLSLRFETAAASNPLVFYVGSAEDDGRGVGATAASLFAIQTDPVPSDVQLLFGTDESALTSSDPEAHAFLEWHAPAAEPEPEVVLYYLENERPPRGAAADIDTRVVVEGIDADTTLDLSLVPDEELALKLTHPGTIDRIELQHTRQALEIKAALEALGGPELILQIDDGTGEINVTNSTEFGMEFEVSRPGNGFFGGAFRNPVDWIFVSALGFDQLTVGSGQDGETTVVFPHGPADLVFVAADDPEDLRFPANQSIFWPGGHPSQWPPIPEAQDLVRVGIVDAPEGTTIAVRTNDTPSLHVDLDADSLGQMIAVDAPEETRLQVDAEVERVGSSSRTLLGCAALLDPGTISFDLQPPGSLAFLSAGGTDLSCYGESETKSLDFHAADFPARLTAEFDTDRESGSLNFRAEDANRADAPVSMAGLVLTDVDGGLTGTEPLGAPAELLALQAEELPSTHGEWSHVAGGELDFLVESTAVEDRIEGLKFVLSTNNDAFVEPFKPGIELDVPRLNRTGLKPSFLPSDELAVHLWELPEVTLLAAAVDSARRLEASNSADGEASVEMELASDLPLVVELFLPPEGHFLGDVGVRGWCDLAVPAGTSGFNAQLPEAFSLTSDNSSGFASLECRQWIERLAEPAFDINASVDGHSIPGGTTVTMDIGQGNAGIATDTDPIGDVSLEIRDRSESGLPIASPFAHSLGALGFRADGAHSLAATWDFASEGMASIEVSATDAANALQFQADTRDDAQELGQPPTGHMLHLSDQGDLLVADRETPGRGQFQLALSDLLHAGFNYTKDRDLNIELETSQSNPLAIDGFIDFDSPLAPISPSRLPLQISAEAEIADISTSFSYQTNLEQRHLVTGATGANLTVHLTIDDDRSDEGTPDDAELEIFVEAQNLPVVFGLDAYDFADQDVQVQGGFLDMSGRLPEIDVVIRDPRRAGVQDTGSQRIRVHAQDVPEQLSFLLDGRLDTEGSGFLALRGFNSGRLGQLLFESDDVVEGHSHFGTRFPRITAELIDVPPRFDLLVNISGDGSATGELLFFDGEIPPDGPGVDDSIGHAQLIVEKERRSFDDDRGTPLQTYASEDFTSSERSSFVRSVDDAYWPAGVRGRLSRAEAGFQLHTAMVPTIPAADGAGAPLQTAALDDYIIVRGTRDADELPELVAFRVSGIHSVEFVASPTDSTLDLVRPAELTTPPLYLAIEDYLGVAYDELKDKPKPKTGDNGAPEVEDDEKSVEYTGQPIQSFTVDVLANDGDTADADTLRVVYGPEFGEARAEEGKLVYTPDDPHQVGRDRLIYEVCTAGGACAEARVNIRIYEVYIGGTYARIESLPNAFNLFTRGYLFLDEVPIIERVGYVAAQAPGPVDVYHGPRTLPPKSTPDRLRVQARQAPDSLTWFLTHPKSYLFRYKADATGTTDIAGVRTTAEGRTWFGVRGEGGFELGGSATGLISRLITGDRPAEEFRGCDRVLGIDTCVNLIGIGVVGSAEGAGLDGFFSYAPLTETTLVARSNGAADFEYLPLITLLSRDLRRIDGDAQLQFDPFKLPPIEVEAKFQVLAANLKLDLWARGADAARIVFGKNIGTFPLPLIASYDINAPFPVIPSLSFDPYR